MKKTIFTTILMAVFFSPLLWRGAGGEVFAQSSRLWATYYGGTAIDYGYSVATDASGNVYMAGSTTSSAGISSGGTQNAFGGGVDAFLVKFNSAGARLWATYYGGPGQDNGWNVATDALGNVYLAGVTASSSGIASGGYQNVIGGSDDVFLVKFDGNGTRLWATYYGGPAQDYGGTSVAIDASGNVYLGGATWGSTTGIASGGFQNTYGGGSADAFLVKFNSAGSRLWATYYGDTGDDYLTNVGHKVATDAAGNVYMAGYTNSAAGIASGGFQNTLGGGADAFLIKFDTSGGLIWATYYGGTGFDLAESVTLDVAGNVYMSGETSSTAGIASGGFQNTYGGGTENAFVVKFDGGGNRLWATYYGGTGDERGFTVTTDAFGNVNLAGETTSPAGIASGGYQNTFGGGGDAFLVKFDANGSRLCATYYGGTGFDRGFGVASDASGNVYLAGYAGTASGIASGGFKNNLDGMFDGFLVKFASCSTVLNITASSTNILCNGQCNGTGTATPSGGTSPYTYAWNPAAAGQTTAIATGLCPNTYTVTVTDGSGGTATTTFTITQPAVLTAAISSVNPNCNGTASAVVAAGGGSPSYTYLWSPSGGMSSAATGLSSGNYTATVTDANGCTITATVGITQPAALTSTISSANVSCNGGNNGSAAVTVSGGTPAYTYSWSPGGGTSSTATGLSSGIYLVNVMDANNCTQTQTVAVTQTPGPTATATASPLIITTGASTTLFATGAGIYSWSPSNGLSCVTCPNPVASPTQTTAYCVTVTNTNNCSDTACVTVTIEPLDCSSVGELYIPNAFSPNGDNENDVLKLYYGTPQCIKTFKLIIYDRWGEKVFETKNSIVEWDGYYKGKMENTAVFVYYLEATLISGEEIGRKGNMSILR